MDYNTVFYQMTPNEISEANSALDHYCDLLEKAAKKK